jgi:hypothetical protein
MRPDWRIDSSIFTPGFIVERIERCHALISARPGPSGLSRE